MSASGEVSFWLKADILRMSVDICFKAYASRELGKGSAARMYRRRRNIRSIVTIGSSRYDFRACYRGRPMLRAYSAAVLLLALLEPVVAAPRLLACQVPFYNIGWPCGRFQCKLQDYSSMPANLRPSEGACYCMTLPNWRVRGYVTRLDPNQNLADPKTGKIVRWSPRYCLGACPAPSEPQPPIADYVLACAFLAPSDRGDRSAPVRQYR